MARDEVRRILPADIKREVIVKDDKAETNPKWGFPPDKRPIELHIQYGVINLDKPPGPTSHEVVAWIKRILNLEKAGHGGTLDPKVSGVLPVALERATRVVQALLPAGKEYVALMHLHGDVPEDKIRAVMKEFEGEIIQRPPLRSAVKRRLRTRKVYYIEILEIDGRDVLFRVGVEAGTYIRSLIHHIGLALGVGAHMAELRRTRSGPFKEDETLVTLHDLVDYYHFWKEDGIEEYIRKAIQPMEKAVEHLPKIWIKDSAVAAVAHGANLTVPGIVKLNAGIKKGDLVAIMTLKDELVALGKAMMSTQEMIERSKGIAVDVEKVFMPRDWYPKLW
ncbi:RNA-guided pseudouridylation complex pseudouridine synthase subunit Cbf5 [Pyrococcus abyssi]|uniref:Probable tRNA pseudouridine synthase B n=1 Tax=Pyrococcus abyssi (strain GE5 / Orsay) TaxID=272844 RepID=TRUB_PYRAB|nr:RNA-guided pseudouridylation complex pseudouridine synthase subunit Cbf5 [Pyrococcus abyssi]Q9V1A5.1 RecName: Full=Probable tRNA pseudouridine synthase B; AltName: Full=tRNA pseudouridine(55) synthase; Short=Psi55 synthase; AltName: Full=tRNA pseudouridylate synthase; AltName: Full=tRNA-uridine isomerase [Pyrococcus abyssi GE5]2AUS_A Chain A, pseudouridine synthase [Pyrococcus abyssi]2AUS_C Chain C, pseudouridine synthase [Pyrococcus abyssi]CAB49444.1 truB tRNA pseudouridine synthase II [Pyr